MDPNKLLKGKKILIVDDEKDVLDQLIELLDMCRVDAASSFEEGKKLLERESYDIAVLDIMGVKGMELLKIANKQNIPALMLTAHALSEESLKESAEEGASFYAPKEEINNIGLFVADVLEAKEKNKNP
jgi:DNA-binding response OmpR family regulator